MKKISRNVT